MGGWHGVGVRSRGIPNRHNCCDDPNGDCYHDYLLHYASITYNGRITVFVSSTQDRRSHGIRSYS